MVTSSANKIAGNAKAAITKLDQELEQLRLVLSGYQEEAAQLEVDASAQAERLRALASARDTAAQEVHRAELAAEMAQGTDREQATNEYMRACSEIWDAARLALEKEIEQAGLLAVVRKERRAYLDHCTADTSKMLNEQSARRAELMSIYTQNHDEHGREEYRLLLQEEAKLLERVEVEKRRLENAEGRLAKWRSEVSERFADWPDMQSAIVVKHGLGASSGLAQLLQATNSYYEELETALAAIPWTVDQLDIFVGQSHLWSLVAMRPADMRLTFDAIHRKWSDKLYRQNYNLLSLSERRKQIAEAQRFLEMSERRTTPAAYEAIEKDLARLAAEEQMVETAY